MSNPINVTSVVDAPKAPKAPRAPKSKPVVKAKAPKSKKVEAPSTKIAKAKAAAKGKGTAKAARPVDPNRITLLDEVKAILKGAKDGMTTTEIAAKVVERGKYTKRDGSKYGEGELWPYTIWQLAEKSPELKRKKTTVTLAAK